MAAESKASSPSRAVREHWPEYLMEAAGLGLFLASACAFATLIEHPGSPVRQAVEDPLARRALMGAAMGLTAITLIYSPWGKRSGAHLNPGVTVTFLLLGRVAPWDAAFYGLAQVVGALAGVGLAWVAIGPPLADPAVNYVATVPGADGAAVAFAAEAAMSFGLMLTVLTVSNVPRINRFTGLCAAALVAVYILVEAPLSGMSMNPARSLGSASFAGALEPLWLYFTAPPLGMALAAAVYAGLRGRAAVLCGKLHHENDARCIFRCRYRHHAAARTAARATAIPDPGSIRAT